jgi:TolB-like protein/DNA-binding winged helix-turn-helix (wHTH) protein/Flp pilus assembly protein TadD
MSNLTSNLYAFGEFSLDPQGRVLRRGAETLALTPKAFDVLLLLIQNPGRIVTKDELMKAVWPDSFVEESNLTQTIFMVRKALYETSDRRYILTVQGEGYRFVVPVTEGAINGPETETPVPPAEAVRVSETPARALPRPEKDRRRTAVMFAGAAAFILMVVAAGWFWRSRPAEPGRIMLAVLPFENFTGDAGQDYFSDGLTEEMISQLGNLDPAHLGVIARTSVMRYKHSPESIPQIAKDLGVQYVIEGSVRRDSERVRITAQLIQAKDQSHLWARQYDRDLEHLLELQAEIAREVANEIEFSLSGRRPIEAARKSALGAPGTKSYEAYDLYLKGRYFWNKRTAEGFRQAADYFQQAIDKDASFGRAYAGLADTFSLMSTWYVGPQSELMPKARAAAFRALELDETLAEAHASLALIMENYDYDWTGAEREFRRAIQLDPQYPTAHQWYAESLSWQGRFDEALAESERARQLDPLSPIIATDHGAILYESRQYESALKEYRSVTELDPTFSHAADSMIQVYLQLGRYDEAMNGVSRWAARTEGPWIWVWKAAVLSHSGHAEEARQALATLEQISAGRPYRTVTLLNAYAGTGQNERAIELLQKAYSEHSNAVVQIKVDPMFDSLRGDPRFEDMLRRVGLGR